MGTSQHRFTCMAIVRRRCSGSQWQPGTTMRVKLQQPTKDGLFESTITGKLALNLDL